jgi:hypothetical protein
VELTFQDFGVRNPCISGFWGSGFQKPKHQPQTIPEITKRKEHGTNISTTFQNSKGFFGDFKCQTTAHNNSRILKGERVWNQHFGISDFGVSGFQMSNNNTLQFPNSER